MCKTHFQKIDRETPPRYNDYLLFHLVCKETFIILLSVPKKLQSWRELLNIILLLSCTISFSYLCIEKRNGTIITKPYLFCKYRNTKQTSNIGLKDIMSISWTPWFRHMLWYFTKHQCNENSWCQCGAHEVRKKTKL